MVSYTVEVDGGTKFVGGLEGTIKFLRHEVSTQSGGNVSARIAEFQDLNFLDGFGKTLHSGLGGHNHKLFLAGKTFTVRRQELSDKVQSECFCVYTNDVVTCIGTRFACVVHVQEALIPFGMSAYEQIKGVAAFALESGDTAVVTIGSSVIKIERMK